MLFISTINLSLNYNNKNLNINSYIFKLIYVPIIIYLFYIFSLTPWGILLVNLFLCLEFYLLDPFIMNMNAGQNPNNLEILMGSNVHPVIKFRAINNEFSVLEITYPNMSPENKLYLYARAFKMWDYDPRSLTSRDAAIIKMAFSQNLDVINPYNKPLLMGLENNYPVGYKNGIFSNLTGRENNNLKKMGTLFICICKCQIIKWYLIITQLMMN